MPLAGGTVTSLGGDWPYVSLPEWVRLIPWAGGFEGYGLVGGCCGTPLGEISSACAMTAYEEQGVLTTPSPYLLDGATDGTTIYWAGWWCGNVVVMARGLPFGGCLPGSPFGPVVDLPASRIAVDDTYVYLYANGTISRAFK
jgi:hypothetical protein